MKLSPGARPKSFGTKIYCLIKWHDLGAFHNFHLAERRQIIDDVISRRRELLQEKNIEPQKFSTQSAQGEIVVFNPYMTLWCGGAEFYSDGFFDSENAPPLGTWIGYLKRQDLPENVICDKWWASQLHCFVPQKYVDLAHEGISANPEGCIAWLEDVWQWR